MCITQENGAKCVCTEGFQYIEANNSCIGMDIYFLFFNSPICYRTLVYKYQDDPNLDVLLCVHNSN